MLPSLDITPQFNQLLQEGGAPKTRGPSAFDVDAIEGFVKEAYRIVRIPARSFHLLPRGLFPWPWTR